ncbi:hypothetical protein [Dokdonella soli]|uniref:hypothetical protein n=1 Tax=Dokdonella soli TaxID=529810 RepID=UPI0031E1734D
MVNTGCDVSSSVRLMRLPTTVMLSSFYASLDSDGVSAANAGMAGPTAQAQAMASAVRRNRRRSIVSK